MGFVGLGLGEFVVLAAALGGLITALYLADRVRRRRVVSTLRFWQQALYPARRKFTRVREPWSLALQLASLVLLLLAIAHPRWGTRESGRDYVLLLDTSAWTSETGGGKTVLDREKEAARAYLRSLSPEDRVLLVRADALLTPATRFTANRARSEQAIAASVTAPRALDLGRALAFAGVAERANGNPGGVVYIGPGIISRRVQIPAGMHNFRAIEIPVSRDDCGIRRIVAQRNQASPGSWNVSITVRNYGENPRKVTIRASFGRNLLPSQSIALGPGEQRQAEFTVATNAAGSLAAQIQPGDALAIDDRAQINLPASTPVRVAIFTTRARALQPLFSGDQNLAPMFYSPSAYRDSISAQIVVFDRFAPSAAAKVPALWIDPSQQESPLPVASVEQAIEVTGWNPSAGLTGGLNEALELPQTEIFQLFEGDLAVANTRDGPAVVARRASPGHTKSAIIGFDPLAKPLRGRLATPLLVAHLLHWLAPGAFSASELEAVPQGMMPAGKGVIPSLPNVAAIRWEPPPGVSKGLPQQRVFAHKPDTLWKWLALAAAILLVAEWLLFGRRKRSYKRLAIKAASLGAIAAALAAPAIEARVARVAAAVLIDRSASIQSAERARASSVAAAIERQGGGNWVRVMPFSSGSDAEATNLEAALLRGAASLPAGYVPRLVLLSDGYENSGSARRAIRELSALHLGVDTIPLAAQTGGALRFTSVDIPAEAYTGEQIPIRVHVRARNAGRGSIELQADGKPLGVHAIELQPGANTIRVMARVNAAGVAEISGRIVEGAEQVSFARAISLRRGRVLYLSRDLPQSDRNLISALRAAGLQVTRQAPGMPAAELSEYALVVLSDVNLAVLAPPEKARLEKYVEDGGGLLLIGGGREVYRKPDPADALDRVLPAQVAPPKSEERTAVVLIIDKSSSMEGRKIRLARLSAIGVVDHLRPADAIGVLMFDNSYRWAVPMRRATDKPLIARSIAGIVPNGGTQIAPALAEAYKKVLAAKAAYKHIVLLTDGISEAGDSFALAHDAMLHHVTISTVGLGLDVNRSYLEKIAAMSGGHSYFLSEPQGLQQIVLKDVQNFAATSAVEKPLKPIVDRKAQILEGVGMESAPALKGYTRFIAKPDADTILSIDPVRRDPLYVEWQYGLGRAAVFASDAKSRWADAWIGWPGFDKFWINVSRDLLRQPRDNAQAVFDAGNGDVMVRYRIPRNLGEPAAPPEIFAIGDGGFEKRVEIQKAAPRLYYGYVHIGHARGLIRIRPVAESAALPETGIYRGDAENSVHGTNEGLLREISAATGGRYDPPLRSIFDSKGQFADQRLNLWPGLLALAIVLGLAELIVRKWGAAWNAILSAANALRLRSGTFAGTDR